MTIRSRLICSFIFMAFLAGGLSYVVLHATGAGDVTSAKGVATILSLEDVRFAGLVGLVTAANEADRLGTKQALSPIGVAREKEGEANEEAVVVSEEDRYEQALAAYAAFLDREPEETAFLKRLTETGRSLQQRNRELLALKKQGTGGSAPLAAKKEELEKAKDAFLEVVDAAIQNERRRLADNTPQGDGVAAGAHRRIVLVSGLTSLIVLVVGIFIFSSVSHPFSAFAQAAVEVGNGRFDESLEDAIRVELSKRDILLRDEIAVLAGVFTTLFKRLQAAHAQVENYQQNLESQVAQRTLALRQAVDQARESVQRAESTYRSKFQWLVALSQELDSSVRDVLDDTEPLLAAQLSGQQRQFAEAAHEAGKKLLHCIDELVDFSKIEAGDLKVEAIDFELRPFVEDLAGLYAESAQKQGLELVCQIADDAPATVQGDPHRLRQVLTSLISNAIQFTEKGEVGIDVQRATSNVLTAPLSFSTVNLRFSVRDTGAGVPLETQQSFSQSLPQVESSATREYTSVGSSLVVAKQLVQLMKGEMGVSSSPGVGSTFWFTVPLTERSPLAPALMSQKLQGWRVLIVDNNAANRMLLQQQCAAWGMHSAEAENGAQALAKLHAGAQSGALYTVALLDLHLPGMDVLQLARAIKTDPAIASVRLLMLTSPGPYEGAHEARRAGVETCLSKPIRQADLYRALATPSASQAAPLSSVAPSGEENVARSSDATLPVRGEAASQEHPPSHTIIP